MATYTGTPANDTYTGTTGTDTITGAGGDDSLAGGGENDLIGGDTGNDTLDGGYGSDSITGGTGTDSILGGAGNDTIDAGIENDTVDGGSNNDNILAGDGTNSITGGSGHDTITSGTGDDIIYGDKNPADTVPGGQWDYQAYVYNNNFTHYGGPAVPHNYLGINVSGPPITVTFQDDDGFLKTDGLGAGDDQFTDTNQFVIINGVQYPVFMEQIVTYIDASTGLTYNFLQCDYDANLSGGNAGNADRAEQGSLQVLLSPTPPPSGATLTVVPGSTNTTSDHEYDTNYNDLINSGAGNDSIQGQLGNDTIDADLGADTIDGGVGDDSIRGGDSLDGGIDSIQGGTGNDTIYGGAGGDTLTGDYAGDTLPGADLIFGEAGADSMDGGIGDDTLDGGTENDTILGGAGNDSIQGGTGSDTIDGGIGDDAIVGGDSLDGGIDTIQGGTGNDTIYGGAGGDTLTGDYAGDTLAGADQIFGDSGDDSIDGGIGNDTLDGGSENDTILGGAGDDSIQGGAGTDTIDGGVGNDSIQGGDSLDGGSDTIQGGTGNDTIYGGAGGDTLTGDYAGDTLPGADQIFGEAGDDSIDGGIGNDTLDGGTENDTLVGGLGDDSLVGGTGTDSLSGGAGIDALVGGAGADTLDGGGGNDQISTGLGDVATGGDDRDTFTLELIPGDTGAFNVDGGTGSTAGADADDVDSIVLGPGLTFVLGSMSKTQDEAAPSLSYTGTFQVTDGTNTYTVNFQEIENLPICFVRGSLIETMTGAKPVEALRAGDMIRTRDNGFKPISWIGSRVFQNDHSEAMQKISPIRICAGALGEGLPLRDLYLSPQHRVLVRSRIARRMFGEDEVLVAVKHLQELPGIETVADFGEVEYFHLLFDQHEIVYADGLEAESLHTGPLALKSLDAAALDEIFTLFPQLADPAPDALRDMARMVPQGKQARQLVQRHIKQGIPLQ